MSGSKLTYEDITQRFFRDFPEFPFNGAGQAGPGINASLATENFRYENTPYFYKGERKFIHFTKAEFLHSILEEQSIRLYNLFNSKDKNECIRASKELNLESFIDYNKSSFYSFSFCELSDLKNYFIWQRYGNKYSGVAIQFSIENEPTKWDKFYLSKMHYQKPKHFTKLKKFLDEIQDSNWKIDYINIGNILGFHKDKKFNKEKEVRLASFVPFSNYDDLEKLAIETWKIDNVSKRPIPTKYIRLPLWLDENYWEFKILPTPPEFPELGMKFSSIPKIKIEKIYVGHKFCAEENMDEYRRFLGNKVYKRLGYGIDVEVCEAGASL